MKTTTDTQNVTKKNYKVKNWKAYNQALVQRGSLTLWMNEDIVSLWYGSGRNVYSDKAIEIMMTLKILYQLPLRSVVGLMQSLFEFSGKTLPTPDYTTVSRRMKRITITLKKTRKDTTDIILDSTGLKLYGEGEWKVRKHGWNYRRTWKKVHVGIDSIGEIRSVVTTHSGTHDSIMTDILLKQEQAIITDFYGDGAYDSYGVYTSLMARSVQNYHIPPQHNAKITYDTSVYYPRDENIRHIQKTSRQRWKQESGYHKRSLIESTMFRMKRVCKGTLSFRNSSSQDNEVILLCTILNTFHSLGMPRSVVTI
jgi:hypothetical protein